MKLPTTRKQAIVKGHNKYNTGVKCNRGHSASRYTSSGICVECHRLNMNKYNQGKEIGAVKMKLSVKKENTDIVKRVVDIINSSPDRAYKMLLYADKI